MTLNNLEPGNHLIEFDNVVKEFKAKKNGIRIKFNAVDGVSLKLNSGESIAIVGASGSGKSTMAKMTVRLLTPTSGEIRYKGHNLSEFTKKELLNYRRKTQMLFQDPYYSLDPTKRIGWHIIRPLKLIKTPKDEILKRAFELLEKVELVPPENFIDKFPYELSGGQRQRAFLARILAMDPEIIIADEPVSMLDASLRAELLILIKQLITKEGVTMIYITHDISTVRYVSSKIYVMNQGKIVESGPVNSVLDNPQNEYTKKLISATPDPYLRI
jgi:peptide/nickel transport system ATP-binding protein